MKRSKGDGALPAAGEKVGARQPRSRRARSVSDAELTLGAGKNGPQKRVGRPSDWTEAKANKFIAVLADSCNVSLAARAVRRSIGNVYQQRARDAVFRAAWDQALAIGYAKLEMMMLERALHGVEKAVTLKSGESRIMREYNDRVALALLRQHRDTVAAIEEPIDGEEYEDVCARLLDKLARLRERAEADGGPVETKTGGDRPALIALGLEARAAERR